MAVIPRPASTVVLMDDMAKICLTKRPITMKFLGGFYVFPGGAVDRGDNIERSTLLINMKQNKKYIAYYVAAARELFEEVGILLAIGNEGSAPKLSEEIEQEYRNLLVKGEISFLQMLKREKLHLDFESLTYFGSITTPEIHPFRFDTRFFLAKLPKGQYLNPDIHEVDEAIWISPEEALLGYQKGELPMSYPTKLSLRAIINHREGAPLKLQ